MIVLKILTLILILVGVIFIYDARLLTIEWFSFGEQNEATSGMKILGFLFTAIGTLIFYIIK